MKRIFEFSVALLLLLCSAPALLVCALVIRLTVSGPVLITRQHKDTQGKSFDVYYFQMPPNFIGRWLRRVSIDTLPQLINVLRGEMSLIGPPLV